MLGLLTRGERSGYDLVRCAQQGVGHIWSPAKSQIYAVLPRLEAAGLATRRAVVQADRPDKQLWRVTPAGEGALLDWLRSEPESNDLFLLRVFFGGLLPRESCAALIERFRARMHAQLDEYRDIERRIAGSEADSFGYLTLRLGLARTAAAIAWADEALAELT